MGFGFSEFNKRNSIVARQGFAFERSFKIIRVKSCFSAYYAKSFTNGIGIDSSSAFYAHH